MTTERNGIKITVHGIPESEDISLSNTLKTNLEIFQIMIIYYNLYILK